MGCRTTYFSNFNCRPTYAWTPASGAEGPPGPAGPAGSGTIDDTINFIAGETLLQRDAVFIKSDGRVYKAVALSISASFDIGFTISGALVGETVPVDTRHGKNLGNFSGLLSGSRYFLSESYGKISTNIPENKDSMVYEIGIAKSNTELIFRPELRVLK